MARSKYEANGETIHPIILSAARLAAAGNPPTGAVNSPIKAKVSKTGREFGLRPRGVRLSRTIGTAPNTFQKYAFLPVLTEAAWGVAPFAIDQTITIGSVEWTVVALVAEDY